MAPLFLSFLLMAITAQAQNRSEPLGSFNNGSLRGAVELPAAGDGFMHLYRDEGRGWGTVEMIDLIQSVSRYISRLHPGPGRLQVEDISAREGGYLEGHGSHQNGLDVDLTYYRKDGLEHDPQVRGQKYSDPMVIDGKISSNFDHKKNWDFVKALHDQGSVNRIFMDNVIKQELCLYARSVGELRTHAQVLRSIRHVENHQDHMHLRLNCPTYARRCIGQAPPPRGTGCFN